MAIVLNDGYLLEGDAGTASTIDYTVSGLDGTTLIMLASGQLANSKATLHTASGVDTIAGITLFNTGSAMAVNLYINDGASRQIVGIDSLGAGFHATYDGKTLSVYDENGSLQIETTALAHAASHTDGSDDIQTSSPTQKGIVELAIDSEVNTGTSTALAISPDALAGSLIGSRIIYIKCLAFDTAVAVADELAYVTIPIELNGMNLVLAHACVYTKSSGGLPEITLERSVDQGSNWTNMLSTSITIDENEFSSYVAATPPVIDGGQDDVATGYWIRVNVDTAGTGTKGLDAILTFQLP